MKKLSKRKLGLLAAQWERDTRTIRRWLKSKHPLLTHPDSLKIINDTKPTDQEAANV